jgi:hypothetical protein
MASSFSLANHSLPWSIARATGGWYLLNERWIPSHANLFFLGNHSLTWSIAGATGGWYLLDGRRRAEFVGVLWDEASVDVPLPEVWAVKDELVVLDGGRHPGDDHFVQCALHSLDCLGSVLAPYNQLAQQ